MKTDDQIAALYEGRKKKMGPLHAVARNIKEAYSGDMVLPLAEMDANEQNYNANILHLGLEQNAMRVASHLPVVNWPSIGVTGKASEERARQRSAAHSAWWEESAMPILMQKRARQLIGYAMSAVLILPDPAVRMPRWHLRDALCTYPADTMIGDVYPHNCIFVTQRPLGWLREHFPAQASRISKKSGSPDDLYEILEYVDAEEYVQVAVGRLPEGPWATGTLAGDPYVRLTHIANRTGVPLAIIPRRVSLDEPQGQFDQLLGMFQMQAKLMAIELHGMARSVWPETWAVSQVAGETPVIVEPADASQGIIGVISGGTINAFHPLPAALTNQSIDRLERNQRVQGGVPPEFGGESGSNIRTGRRGQDILSNAIDPQILTHHLIFQQSMKCENHVAVAIDKEYFAGTKTIFSFTRGEVTYDTASVWETDKNEVKYSQPGVDQGDLITGSGQRLGMGTLSKRSFMEIDPLVADPELESDRITAEALELAALSGIQTAASSDPSFLPVVARMTELIRSDKKEFIDAFMQAQKELQEKQQQATEGQLPPEQMQPGVADPQAAIGPPPASLDNLSSTLLQLRGSGRGAAAPAAGGGRA